MTGHVDRAGHPLGGAVAGAGLGGGHVGVGHEVHVGPGDAAGVGGQDDGAVHLGQLGQALRAERGVEQEAARADVEHLGAVADHDERAHVGLQDAVEALAQRLPGRDRGERVEHARRCGGEPRPSCYRWSPPPPVAGNERSATARLDARARRQTARARPPRRRGRPAARSMPGGRLGRRAGTMARVNPSRARLGQPALESGPPGAARRPGRPRRTPPGRRGSGWPVEREATARARRQIGAGLDDAAPRRRPGRRRRDAERDAAARCSSTASSSASRPPSTPWAERRGDGRLGGATSACTSTSSGRWPSMVGTTTEPATPRRRSARNRPLASGTARRPSSLISNRPSSSVDPNRCFDRPQQAQARGAGRPRRPARCRPRARAPAARPGRRPW